MKTKYYFFSLIAFVLCSFVAKTDDSDYEKEIREWHKNRIEGLKKKLAEFSWIILVGGRENSFGADRSNKIVFPENRSKKN